MFPPIRVILPCCLLTLSAAPAPAQSWFETLIEVGQRRDAGDVAAAADLGSELVERAIEEFGEISERVAESHMVTSEMQLADRNLRGAEQSLLSAIEIYDQLEGPTSALLIEPYTLLGDAYRTGDENELALGAYFDARNISRRVYGLYNPDQVAIVNKMADASAASGDLERALELKQESIDITQIAHGERSREFYDELHRLADWLSEREYYSDAGRYYMIASNVLRFGLNGDPVEVVATLRLSAQNLRMGSAKLGYPSQLMAALQIVHSLGDQQLLLEAEVLRDIGDWYVGSGNYTAMEEAYSRAWRVLDRLENGDELKEQWFSRTAAVYLAPFRARELSERDDAPRGFVDVAFRVDTKGTADRISVIDGNPAGLLDGDAKQRVNNSRFRPGVEDGRVVPVDRVIRLEFGYDTRYAKDGKN